MAHDLITLSVIRHEDNNNYPRRPSLPSLPLADAKLSQVSVAETEINPSTDNMMSTSDARKKSLVTMYSTGFVFNQNQKSFVKALPWSGSKSCASLNHSPVMTSEDRQKMATQFAEGRDKRRKSICERQVQTLQSEKFRSEHAASMFALLT